MIPNLPRGDRLNQNAGGRVKQGTVGSEATQAAGARATEGFLWLALNTMSGKGVQLAGQVVLAWLLNPADFGLVGLAYTVTAFTALIEQAGIREILVRRHKQYDDWVNPAFWMALSLGVMAAVVTIGVAPFVASAYGEPALVGMLGILAVASPIASVQSVTQASLQGGMHFRLITLGGMGQSLGQMCLAVMFAWLGFGAYSFVLPRPIVAASGLALQWWLTRPKIRWSPEFHRWHRLLRDSAMQLSASAILMITFQGDYIVLGLMQPVAIVGTYYFAFNLSTQSLTLITRNVASVLLPTLSRLQDDVVVQTRTYIRAAKLLVVVATPAAVLQAALAAPVVRLVFDEKWAPAIPLLQVLSLGMMFRVVGSTAGSLLQAQGRYALRLRLSAGYSGLFLMLLLAGASLGGAMSVALSVSAYFVIAGVMHPLIVIRAGGGTVRDIASLFVPPVACSSSAAAIGVLFASILPPTRAGTIGQILIITVTTVGLYVLAIRHLAPDASRELVSRMSPVVGRMLSPFKRNLRL